MSKNIQHTVYLSYEEGEDGRMYVGKHSTTDPNDDYLGSFKDKSFNPVGKIILEIYGTSEEAILGEIFWQQTLQVVEDPRFANRAYQTSTGFKNPGGWNQSDESKQKISSSLSGVKKSEEWVERRRSKFGELAPFHGQNHSEDTKRKMSAAHRGKIWATDGESEMQLPAGSDIPDGWRRGRKRNLPKGLKGKI